MNDLLIPLKEDSRFPMYRQIYDHIKNEIQKGKDEGRGKNCLLPDFWQKISVSAEVRWIWLMTSYLRKDILRLFPVKVTMSARWRGFIFSTEKKVFPEKNPGREIPAPAYRWDFALNGIAPGGFPQNTWRKLSREVLFSGRGRSLLNWEIPVESPGSVRRWQNISTMPGEWTVIRTRSLSGREMTIF